MSNLFAAGQHPDGDQLSAFVEHVLPAHEQQQTMAHLAECARCRQVVALSLPAMEQPQVVQPWFSGRRLAWAGVPALAVLIFLVFFLRTGQVAKQKSAATQMATVRATPPVPAQEPAPMPPSPALRGLAPLTQRMRHTPPAGVAGGVLGGIASEPMKLNQSFAAAASSQTPAFALANRRAVDVLSAPTALPSHLAALSMVSEGRRRLAVDTGNQVFYSSDDGKHWRPVPPQWQGRAVRVSLAGSSLGAAPLLRVSALPAASGTASISGTVTDPTGAVIPGTTVAATDSHGAVVRVVTNQQGQFRMEHLAPGGYRLEAEKPGFENQSLSTEIAPSQQSVMDLSLQVASAAQTVMVQSEGQQVELSGRRFALTTEDGSRWVSADGLSWKPE